VSDSFVLDTSALLSLIEGEQGADRVAAILRQETVWHPWLVLMETHYISLQERGRAEADVRYALLKQLPATILWEASESVLLTASRIKAHHRLSLADAIIAAFAHQLQATLVHKDPEYEVLSSEISLEALPFK
jgi:predicted nucleic acid-binding protein